MTVVPVVQRFIDEHPEVPMTLIGEDANEGASVRTRHRLRAARAPLVMVLDADNMIFPSCLRKLDAPCPRHPHVDAAYAILEDFGGQRDVRSADRVGCRSCCTTPTTSMPSR